MPLGQDVAVTLTEPPTPCHIDRDSDVAVRHLGQPATVMVCRDGGGWSAEVAALGVARTARSLVTLDRQVRELLSTETVDYHFRTGDGELDRLVRAIRAARVSARMFDARAQRLIARVLMLPSGGSARNLAVLVGLSHQRVHQLLKQQLATTSGQPYP